MKKRLNVGCGQDIRPKEEGWVNLDVLPLHGVEVAHDLVDFPWPFEDGSFDYVLMRHVLEHIPHRIQGQSKDGFVLLMEELHRILRPEGRVEIFSPHHASEDQLADPTHTRAVHFRNFEYFSPVSAYNYYSPASFRVLHQGVSRRHLVAPHTFRLGSSRLGLTQHLALRLPFLRPALSWRPAEIHVVLEKAQRPHGHA